jgi:hypothetical protein
MAVKKILSYKISQSSRKKRMVILRDKFERFRILDASQEFVDWCIEYDIPMDIQDDNGWIKITINGVPDEVLFYLTWKGV